MQFAFGSGYSVFAEDGGVFFCSELKSSGANDEVLGAMSSILVFPMLLRLFRIQSHTVWWETTLGFVALGIVILVLTLGLECGEVISTLKVGNIALLACLLGAVMAIVLNTALLKFSSRQS